jgi:hypothetical protein
MMLIMQDRWNLQPWISTVANMRGIQDDESGRVRLGEAGA